MLITPLLLIALAATVSPPVTIQDASQTPKGWVAIDQPNTDTGWRCANYSRQEWAVAGDLQHGIQVTPHKQTQQITLELTDGTLVGTNHGEFGGAIQWIGRNSPSQVIAPSAHPVAMTTRGSDVFVATGLAHMTLNTGNIIKLHHTKDGSWQTSKVMDLGEAPNAGVRIDDNTWVLLTTNGVTKIDLAKLTKEQIYRNSNWWKLYGNSIQQLGNSWIIGARRAVIRLTPNSNSYAEKWLVPDTCRNLSGPSCDCKE
ncbi:hypothetical protein SAMN05216570_0036 [Dyella sp. OK004]|uniref:hypothetical protein n=1 Tax=Dyella sp. OK004 TaxID=1855292 RepID=UPI0008E1A9AA|nr:hypothetical protein [Dyella sp. OK004]SFR85600.1 hypothetical protein SAMN05216570_0036 [Dyella sp. OK004]